MSMLEETRHVERIQFFNGQRLFAADLDALDGFNREMRWLHNQSLHQPGIGSGYAVYGKKGDRQVTIEPGYAIDALGREIVLTTTQTEPVPPVAGENGDPVFYDLVVSYPPDEDLEEAETREGICMPRGRVRLIEQPVFCWVRLAQTADGLQAKDQQLQADIANGMRIVLARAAVRECALHEALSIAQRRSARPPQLPYIACDVAPGAWEVTPLGDGFVLETEVVTSDAGFLTQPSYWARIERPRPKDRVSVSSTDDHFIDIAISVKDPQVDKFTFWAFLQRISDNRVRVPRAADFADWRVVWMGVEG
jgi:hypothetical protein